jgi:hypothetical protein
VPPCWKGDGSTKGDASIVGNEVVIGDGSKGGEYGTVDEGVEGGGGGEDGESGEDDEVGKGREGSEGGDICEGIEAGEDGDAVGEGNNRYEDDTEVWKDRLISSCWIVLIGLAMVAGLLPWREASTK